MLIEKYILFITEMVDKVTYEILDTLAEKFIPEGIHKILHVDSRELWRDLMVSLLETKAIPRKVSTITNCAISWELLLIQKLSIQN
jgi:hypothetical protein